MAKINFSDVAQVKLVISELKDYRSTLATEIDEKWDVQGYDARQVRYTLYMVAGSIILAMENRLSGNKEDRMAMYIVEEKFNTFLLTDPYDTFNRDKCYKVVTDATRFHVRLMMDCLRALMEK